MFNRCIDLKLIQCPACEYHSKAQPAQREYQCWVDYYTNCISKYSTYYLITQLIARRDYEYKAERSFNYYFYHTFINCFPDKIKLLDNLDRYKVLR